MDKVSLSDRLLPTLFGPTNTTRFPGSSDVPSLNLILVILYRYFAVCVVTEMFIVRKFVIQFGIFVGLWRCTKLSKHKVSEPKS